MGQIEGTVGMNPNIKPFVTPLAAVQQVIDRFNQQGMIIGGIAASLLGKPRLTADIDAVLLLSVDELPNPDKPEPKRLLI